MRKTWKETFLQLLLNNLMYLQQNAFHENERNLYIKHTLQYLHLHPDLKMICDSFNDLDIIKGI